MKIEKHPFNYAWESRFPSAKMVMGFEGGAMYVAEEGGKAFQISDNGTMADFLDPIEDAEMLNQMIVIREFDSVAERDAAVVQTLTNLNLR